MKSLNKGRGLLQKIVEMARKAALFIADAIREDEKEVLAAKMLVIQIGESSKKLDNMYKSKLGSDNIYSKFVNYRNINAHSDVPPESVINMLEKVDLLKATTETLLQTESHNSLNLKKFENFSPLSSKENKTKLIDATISRLIDGDKDEQIPFPTEENIVRYSTAIEEIISHPELLDLSLQYENISLQITEDIATWSDQTKKILDDDDTFAKEEELVHYCITQSPESVFKAFGGIYELISKTYSNDQLNHKFFRKEFNRIKVHKNGESQFRAELSALSKGKFKKNDNLIAFIKSKDFSKIKNRPKVRKNNIESYIEIRNIQLETQKEDLKKNFTTDWNNALQKRKRQYELDLISKERERFKQKLHSKIVDFKKLRELLLPFTNDTKRVWDISGGVWKDVDFSIIEKYSDILKNEKSILELSNFLGSIRELEREYEIQKISITSIAQQFKIVPGLKAEMVGIHESNDIHSAISYEIALLSDHNTEIIFYQKLIDHKLLTFQYQHEYWQEIDENKNIEIKQQKKKKKGPFIICVDTSSSMMGIPERIAKVLCLSILKTAMNENRKCYLISFSNKIETLNLSNLSTSLDKLVKFLNVTFKGGTDAAIAFKEALNLLDKKEFENADVLFVSDFEIGEIDDDLANDINSQKQKGTKFNSLIVTDKIDNPKTVKLFDHNWHYNPSKSGALVQLVKDISNIQ